jgi:hypothetical protein
MHACCSVEIQALLVMSSVCFSALKMAVCKCGYMRDRAVRIELIVEFKNLPPQYAYTVGTAGIAFKVSGQLVKERFGSLH